ncbi:MAG: DUF4258 domain-containing protein [Corynebacterium sp.]|uniref:DUF4258 domain-containing protein n=1 Tax=Corynebacterium sp. TaxID=1720 RepID=UPI001818A292|nr:DUF4258 domain-containing protein [Corynebacterium sp.]
MENELRLSKHARMRMADRNISEEDVRNVLRNYSLSRKADESGKTVYEADLGRIICVVIVEDSDPTFVVTVFSRRKE